MPKNGKLSCVSLFPRAERVACLDYFLGFFAVRLGFSIHSVQFLIVAFNKLHRRYALVKLFTAITQGINVRW